MGRIAAVIQRGGAWPANDTWIAACALTYGLLLATLNGKDFKDFAEHEGLRLIIPALSQQANCTGIPTRLRGRSTQARESLPWPGPLWGG